MPTRTALCSLTTLGRRLPSAPATLNCDRPLALSQPQTSRIHWGILIFLSLDDSTIHGCCKHSFGVGRVVPSLVRLQRKTIVVSEWQLLPTRIQLAGSGEKGDSPYCDEVLHRLTPPYPTSSISAWLLVHQLGRLCSLEEGDQFNDTVEIIGVWEPPLSESEQCEAGRPYIGSDCI